MPAISRKIRRSQRLLRIAVLLALALLPFRSALLTIQRSVELVRDVRNVRACRNENPTVRVLLLESPSNGDVCWCDRESADETHRKAISKREKNHRCAPHRTEEARLAESAPICSSLRIPAFTPSAADRCIAICRLLC